MPRLRRGLVAQTLLPLAVMSGWLLVLVWQRDQLVHTAGWVEHTDQVLAVLHAVERTADRHLAAVRGYLRTDDAALLAPCEDEQAFTRAADQVAALTADNPPQCERSGFWIGLSARSAAA